METQANKKMEWRHRGIYLVLGGLIFAFQWLFKPSDAVIGFLVLALGLIYVFTVQETETKQQPSVAQRILQALAAFMGLIIFVTQVIL